MDTGEIIAFAITDKDVGDSPLMIPLLETAVAAGHRIGKVYADGAYSSVENFEYVCGKLKARFVTSFKVNTKPVNDGSRHRGGCGQAVVQPAVAQWVKVSGMESNWMTNASSAISNGYSVKKSTHSP